MAPPSNSSWLDTPCSLLIRPCCPLPRMSGRSVGRQFCTLDLSCCEDGSGYLSFAVLSSLPSCRLFPFRNVTPNVRNHPRARGGAQLRVRPSLSLRLREFASELSLGAVDGISISSRSLGFAAPTAQCPRALPFPSRKRVK